MARWAFIYEHPDADPLAQRHRVEGGGQVTELIPVPEAGAAPEVAAALASDGVTLIELCGGFSYTVLGVEPLTARTKIHTRDRWSSFVVNDRDLRLR